MHSKPTITTKCVANSYSGDTETIAEFSSPAGGGLISVRHQPAFDHTVVSIYRTDEKVKVLTESTVNAIITNLDAIVALRELAFNPRPEPGSAGIQELAEKQAAHSAAYDKAWAVLKKAGQA